MRVHISVCSGRRRPRAAENILSADLGICHGGGWEFCTEPEKGSRVQVYPAVPRRGLSDPGGEQSVAEPPHSLAKAPLLEAECPLVHGTSLDLASASGPSLTCESLAAGRCAEVGSVRQTGLASHHDPAQDYLVYPSRLRFPFVCQAFGNILELGGESRSYQ